MQTLNDRFTANYRDQQLVEKQIASAVARVILPRLNDDQRGQVLESHQKLTTAQQEHRSLVNDIVDQLVRRGY